MLSLVLDGDADFGVGFDFAENILKQAQETAEKADIKNCEFINCNILEIPEKYFNKFDIVLFTIGALCWFEDLTKLFAVVSKCLKSGGTIIINDGHPVINMLSLPGDEGFNAKAPTNLIHSYFRKEPWIGNNGMYYISGDYESKTFTDFSHTMSDIINGLSLNGIKTVKLNEYDYDIGMIGSDAYDKKGIPLSFILIGEK